MYIIRNTVTGNGMRGKRGIGGMLYSGECRQVFRGMSPNMPGNVLKYSEEYRQIFRGISPKIPGNVLKHFEECRQTFRGMSSNIPENVSLNIPGISSKILRNAHNGLAFKFNCRAPKHWTQFY